MVVHENPFIRFELKGRILYVTVRHAVSPTDAEWAFAKHTMLLFYGAVQQSGQRIAIHFDLRRMGLLPPSRCTDWANLFIAQKEITRKHIVCTCLVTDSMLLRVAVNGFFKLYSPMRPVKFVETVAEACAWIDHQLTV
jgi:hypothetical protein